MSFSEIIIIAVVAVLVLGPEKLPSTLVELAKLIKGIKKQINEAKRAVEDEINIAELREEAERYKREIAAANESVRKRLSLEDFEQIGEQVRGAGEQLREAGEQVREGLAGARAAGASAFAAAAQAAEANVLPDGGGAGGAGGDDVARSAGGAGGAQVSPDAGDFRGRPERVSAGGMDGVIDEEICKNRQPGSRRAAWKQAAEKLANDAADVDGNDNSAVVGGSAGNAGAEENFQKNADIEKLVSGADGCGNSAANADGAAASGAQVSPDAGDFRGRPERVSDGTANADSCGAVGANEQAPGGASTVREQISATNETISDAADVDGNGNSAVVGDGSADNVGAEENFRKNADIEKLVGAAGGCENGAAGSDCSTVGSDAQVSLDTGDFGFASLAELRCAPFGGRPNRVSSGARGVSEQAPGGASALKEQISATSAADSGDSAINGGAATTTAAAHAAQMPTTQENPHA